MDQLAFITEHISDHPVRMAVNDEQSLSSQISRFYGVGSMLVNSYTQKYDYFLNDDWIYSAEKDPKDLIGILGNFNQSKLSYDDVRADFEFHNSFLGKASMVGGKLFPVGFGLSLAGIVLLGFEGYRLATDISVPTAFASLAGLYASNQYQQTHCNGAKEEFLKVAKAANAADQTIYQNQPKLKALLA